MLLTNRPRRPADLDIGAWDGFFSFEAERRGAAHVTALDHHVCCLDHHAHRRDVEECRERGQAPEHFTQVPSIYRPDELPGRAGFDLAPGMEDHQMWEFFEGAELGDDPSNWWAGNGAVLEGLSRAAGFSRAELKTRWFEDDQGDSQPEIRYDRAVVHAIR